MIRNHKELIRREILYSRLERDVERVKKLHDALHRLNEEIIKKWHEIDAEYEKIKQLRDEETQKIHQIILKYSKNPSKKNSLEKFPKGQNETLETTDEEDEYPEEEKAQDEIDGVRKEYGQRTRTIRDKIRAIRSNYESKIDQIGRESTKDRLCNPETINSLVMKRKVLEDETQNILHNIKSLNEYQHGVEIKDLRTKLETINNQQFRVINFQVVCTVHPVPVLDRTPPPIPGRGDPNRKPKRPQRPDNQPKLPPSFTNKRGKGAKTPSVRPTRPAPSNTQKTPKDKTKPSPNLTGTSDRRKPPSNPKDRRNPNNPAGPNKKPPSESPTNPKSPPTKPQRRPKNLRDRLPDDPLHALYNKTKADIDDRIKKIVDSPNKRIFDRIKPFVPKQHCTPIYDETLTRIEQGLRLNRAIVTELRKQLKPEDRRLIQQRFSEAMKTIQQELNILADYHKKCKEFRSGKSPKQPQTPGLPKHPTNGTNHTQGNQTSPANGTIPANPSKPAEPDYSKFRRPGARRPRDNSPRGKTNQRSKLEPDSRAVLESEEIALTKREERRYRSRAPGQPIGLKDLLEGERKFHWTPFAEDEASDQNKTEPNQTNQDDDEPVLPEEFWLKNITLVDEELTKLRKVYLRRRKEFVRRIFDFNSRKKDDVLVVLLQSPHAKNQSRNHTVSVLEEKDRLVTLQRYFEDRFSELTPRDQKVLERHQEFARFLLYQKFRAIQRALKGESAPKDASTNKDQSKDGKHPGTNGTREVSPTSQAAKEVTDLMRKLADRPTGHLVEELLEELPEPKRCTKQMFDLLLAASRDIQNQNATLAADFARLPEADKEILEEEFDLVERLVEKKLGDIEEYLHTCSRKENQRSSSKDSGVVEEGEPTEEESEEYLSNYIRKFQFVSRLISELAAKQLPRDLERFLGEKADFSNDKKATRVRDVQRELHDQLFVVEDEWSDVDEADRKPLEAKYKSAVQHAESLLKRLREYLLKAKQPPVESDEIEPV